MEAVANFQDKRLKRTAGIQMRPARGRGREVQERNSERSCRDALNNFSLGKMGDLTFSSKAVDCPQRQVVLPNISHLNT